jgi:hypothetical protein
MKKITLVFWGESIYGEGSGRLDKLKYKFLELHGLSPRANYTDRATAACRRSDWQIWGQRVPRGQRDGFLRPYSWFSRQEPLLFYQVAPQLYSRGWVDFVPDPSLFFFCEHTVSSKVDYFCFVFLYYFFRYCHNYISSIRCILDWTEIHGRYSPIKVVLRSGGPGSIPGTIRKK